MRDDGVSELLEIAFTKVKISKDLYMIRASDLNTAFFESLWEIPEGITYNSYVLTVNEGAVLFDTVKNTMVDEYIRALSELVDPRDVKYLVVHHMEPDHSGCVKKISELGEPIVLGHSLAGKMLKSFYGFSGKFSPVKDGEELKVGEYTLKFIYTPWLHWPETMVTYVDEMTTLLSCDIFGSYGVFSATYYDELPEFERVKYKWFMKKYFATVIGFYRDWAIKNLSKLSSLAINPFTVLPAHGLAWRDRYVNEVVELYKKWSSGKAEKGKVVIAYLSMYGFIKRAVMDFAAELEKRGIKTSIHEFTDTKRSNISDLIGDIYDSEIVVLATSTYDADAFPLTKYITHLISRKIPREKKVLVLAGYGWSPRAGLEIKNILTQAGFSELKIVEFPAGEHREVLSEAVEYVK
ncbi:MAG: FprA family A-type flavoprotein [Desulfurococcaceae archaeon]